MEVSRFGLRIPSANPNFPDGVDIYFSQGHFYAVPAGTNPAMCFNSDDTVLDLLALDLENGEGGYSGPYGSIAIDPAQRAYARTSTNYPRMWG